MYFEVNEIPRTEKQDFTAIIIAVALIIVVEIAAVVLSRVMPVISMIVQAVIVFGIVFIAIRFYKTRLKSYRYSFFTGEELTKEQEQEAALAFGVSVEKLKEIISAYPKNSLVIESVLGGVSNIICEIAPDEYKGLFDADYKCNNTLIATVTPNTAKKLVYGDNACVSISPSERLERLIIDAIDAEG
ncbi:MAG TPA: hypothetical protein GXZ61_04680 [Clostridiales bacterium]|jgi:hypothetical protein|nr:hypothetical protein [Clostridiales bacterium]